MKYSCRFPISIVSLVVCILFSCARKGDDAVPVFRWESGDEVADSLLSLADHFESPSIEDWEALDSVLLALSGLEKSAPAAALWAQARLMKYDCDDCTDAWRMDSMALAATDPEKSPYLYSRIKLDLAGMIEDPSEQTRIYSELLEYFSEARDSMRMVFTLMEIQGAYSQVWDDSTQVECLREIKRLTPDSLALLRDIMDFNILSMMRQNDASPEYLDMLAGMLSRRSLMEQVPEIGAMVFTDLFRTTGKISYMDTASLYISRISDQNHPVMIPYNLYRLRVFDMRGEPDSARMLAIAAEAVLGGEGGIFDMEITRELMRHYAVAGDTVMVGKLREKLHTDSLVVAAMDKANEMSRIKAARDMARLSNTIHRVDDASGKGAVGLFVSVVVIFVAVAAIGFAIYRRNLRRQKQALEVSLHHASRRLAAACLRNVGNETSEKSTGMEGFETAFTQVRPGFTEELLRHHPGLTTYELRLCSLLSIGLDTKEIARILSIQPDSVKKSRQRLRSKLAIPSGMTFIDYFTFRNRT